MHVTITEQQFFDFISCPAMFEMKYIKKIPCQESTSNSRLLERVGKYFYFNLLNKKICSNSELKNKWDSICQANKDEINSKKVMEGISLITKFALWAQNERLVVLDIDTKYSIQVENIEVIGNLGTITAAPNKKYELLITDFSSRMIEQSSVDMKLKHTLDAYGFNKVHNKFIDGIRAHSVKYDKDFYSTRTDGDFKRLETAIKNVGNSIAYELYYPRESIMCSTCPVKDLCRYWYH